MSRASFMPNRRSRRPDNKPGAKPYGFCCSPDSPRRGPKRSALSIGSLGSLHECPALRIREHVISKRPGRLGRSKDGAKSARSSSALKLNLQSLQEPGGLMLNDATESALELMRDIMRGREQMEYEQRMNRWAVIGERKDLNFKCINAENIVKNRNKSLKKGGKPYWYTDFSLPQLKNLKELEDALFKDKEEKTTSRTLNSLAAIGMISNIVKIEPKDIWKLLKEFSTNPIKFLCEVYKVITGNYFEDEDYRHDYSCNERIILSGIAFLELPKIILELHKRLPPIAKFKLPEKPIAPKALRPKKMESPLLEKLNLPPNWRLYEVDLIKWRKKYLAVPRPVAILPKEKREKEDEDKEIVHDKIIDDVKIKKASTVENDLNIKEKIVKGKKGKKNDKNISVEQTKPIDLDNEDNDTKIAIQEQEPSKVDKEIKQAMQPYLEQNDWTDPPTACPYKYRRLLNQTGPLNTDEQFFSALNPTETRRRSFASGREHLSLKLQQYLLDVEADFFMMTEEANRLTGAVDLIAREIFEPESRPCDPCCSCRQTRKAHLKWHATKTPHQVIEAVVKDEDDNTHVIGALAMHSPAASISSSSQPNFIPSMDKFATNQIIPVSTTTDNGESVHQLAGATKGLEHMPREFLTPEVASMEIRNVPPCGCAEDEKNDEAELKAVARGKDEGLCYGRKFRPNEGPAYSCGEFGRKDDVVEDDCGCGEDVHKCVEEDCGCGEDFEKCLECEEEAVDNALDKDSEYSEETLKVEEEIRFDDMEKLDAEKTCKRCGRKCAVKYSRREDSSEKSDKKGKEKVTAMCSCDSLSEFLQIDITKSKCIMPEKKYLERESINKETLKRDFKIKPKKSSSELKSSSKFSGNKISKTKDDAKIKRKLSTKISSEKHENKLKEPRVERVPVKKNLIAIEKVITDKETSINENCPTTDGPYGCRTASEDALPPERTIAYLVDRHPPDFPAEQIPVRPGGRACRCRENRNKRKTLLYGIGGLVSDRKNAEANDDADKLIEGVCWLTPEPSIKRSDEYIPEYELYDSPYKRQICARGRKEAVGGMDGLDGDEEDGNEEDHQEDGEEEIINREVKGRTKDWKNAFKDPYLTEFFTKKRENIIGWNKCSKFKTKDEEPRKLKVMKPVCECKYERKIVKKNEEKKHWVERQCRLKSMKKESFLHINGITKIVSDSKSITSREEDLQNEKVINRVDQAQIVISAITMQTPLNTPIQSRVRSHLPFDPIASEKTEQVIEVPVAIDPTPKIDEQRSKSVKKKSSKIEMTNSSTKSKQLTEASAEETINDNADKVKNHKVVNDVIEVEKIQPDMAEMNISEKTKGRMSIFDRLEGKLKIKMRHELEKMSDEDFISIKLPDYQNMPQLSYWISYRARGMCFTEKYKKELMEHSIKVWNSKDDKIKTEIGPELFKVAKADRHKINFDRARHWKRQIAKLQSRFYTKLRQDIVHVGREMWRTMEFGKFPNTIFKQAYFTYLPAKETDAYAFRPWVQQ